MAEWTPEHRRLHGERLRFTLDRAHRACVAAADRFARRYLPLLLAMRRRGMGLRAIAVELNANGHTTRCGGPWTDQAVRQLLKRRHHILGSEVYQAQPRLWIIGWSRKV
jgi:hypothetical protein